MAKKAITCEEIIDVFLAHKEEIINKALDELPFKMLEGNQDADGTCNYVLVCPSCHAEFNWSSSGWRTTSTIPCPHCGAHGKGIDEKEISQSEKVNVAIKEGDNIYLSTCCAEYKLDCYGNVLDPKVKFGPFMGVYNTVSHAKAKYEFNRKSWCALSDSPDDYRKTARFFSSGLIYVYSSKSFLFLGFDEIEKTYSGYRDLVDEGDKAMAKKTSKEVEFPLELTEKPPEIKISDIMNITARFESSDLVDKTKSYTLHCHCCGHEWLDTVPQGNSSKPWECPYCGAMQEVFSSYLRAKMVMYVSDSEDMAQVKIVKANYETNDLFSEVKPQLVGYYEFDKKGRCKGFARRSYSADHATSWVTAKPNGKTYTWAIDEFFISDLNGILKYSGLPEFIEQAPESIFKTKYGDIRKQPMESRDILTFIGDTLRYSVIEKIVKQGLAEEYLASKADDYSESSKTESDVIVSLDSKAETVQEAFGISKSLLKYFRETKKKLGCELSMRTLQRLYTIDNSILGEDAYWCDKFKVPVESIVSIQKVVPLRIAQITSYLERVRIAQMFNPIPAAKEWRDYLEACKSLEMDLTDRHVLYPRALKTEHDVVIAKQKFVVDETIRKSFMDAVTEYKSLEYHRDDYFIKVPDTMESMFEEGRKLNHCCGRYVDDVAEGKAFVLFLRHKENPDEPFLSIEVLPDMSVQQVRGMNDSYISVLKESKEVSLFLAHWAKMKHLRLSMH